MPLNRDHVTRGLRVMIPLITGFFGIIGFNYALGGHRLLLTPALAYADSIMPLRSWGVLFIAASLLMSWAMANESRSAYQYALLLCIVSMSIWTFISMAASFDSEATRGGWAYPAFVTLTCVAVYRQLASREAK